MLTKAREQVRYRRALRSLVAPSDENPTYFSRFGGLWTDRRDADAEIDRRLETGSITAAERRAPTSLDRARLRDPGAGGRPGGLRPPQGRPRPRFRRGRRAAADGLPRPRGLPAAGGGNGLGAGASRGRLRVLRVRACCAVQRTDHVVPEDDLRGPTAALPEPDLREGLPAADAPGHDVRDHIVATRVRRFVDSPRGHPAGIGRADVPRRQPPRAGVPLQRPLQALERQARRPRAGARVAQLSSTPTPSGWVWRSGPSSPRRATS